MQRAALMLFIAVSLLFGSNPADAADFSRAAAWREPASAKLLPFPRSARAARIWDARACWSTCQTACTADQAACFKAATEPQADCIAWSDRCDRSCQRECRGGAGPLLPID